jgi:hypothetical protein
MDGNPDDMILAVVKYQLLWAHLEHEPTYEIARRFMSKKQIERVMSYRESIAAIILPDIRSLVSKRRRDKKNYEKSKGLFDIPTGGTADEITGGTTGEPPSASSPQRKVEESKINKTKENENVMPGEAASATGGFKGIPIPQPKWLQNPANPAIAGKCHHLPNR